MIKVFVDDERYPIDDSIVIRNLRDFRNYVTKNGIPNYISFDHDLGDNEPTGMDIVKWLCDYDMDNNSCLFPKVFSFYVHSQNPVGKQNIENYLNGYLHVFYRN